MIHLLSPGSPDQRTGGYRYNARMVHEWRQQGRTVAIHELAGDWPWASPEAVSDAVRVLGTLDGDIVADGLLWTALAPFVERPVTVLLHSPLWREHGPAARLREEAALARAARVVATSRRTARDLDLDPVIVIEPGTQPAIPRPRPRERRLLCVANVVPRKGHDVLIDAVRRLDGAPLRCAGSLDRDPAFVQTVRQAASDLPVTWLGSLDDAALDAAYADSDLLVQAAHYEGYGMAIAEAWARGVPVVSPPAGVLDGREAGHLVVPPNDPAALANAVQSVLDDPALADRLTREASAMDLPTWEAQARAWLEVLA